MRREQKTFTRDTHDPAIEALLGKAGDVSFVDRLMALPPPPLEPELTDEWTRVVTMRLEAVLARNMRAHIDVDSRAAA
ncbi:hypothetical protein [Aminobacter aminovorans]|uniref:hypothetical protein n=1 Tax=Aminobacter aminovorans TaxID=83263 RepID=UPI0028554E12|nr:hypothetical protein [Aminobacter aminovorans]MDR7222189.1 hypothetical protein [Aminobacter aminovorans]